MADLAGNAGTPPPSVRATAAAHAHVSSIVLDDVAQQKQQQQQAPKALSAAALADAKAAIRKAWAYPNNLTPLDIRALAQKARVSYATTTEDGIYVCARCASTLFSSADKFVPEGEAAQWPSFRRVLDPKSVELRKIYSFGLLSNSLHCAECHLFLGEVWEAEEPARYSVYSNCVALISTQTGEVISTAAPHPAAQASSISPLHVILGAAAVAAIGFIVYKFVGSKDSE